MRQTSFITILLAATMLLSTGCGGSSGGGNGTPVNPFAGVYDGTATLDDNKTGTLGLEVEANGSASGTLVVTPGNSLASRAADGFPPGTYAVTGEANSSGLISLAGTVEGVGPFTVGANLPEGAASAQLSIVLGGVTYNGSVAAHSDSPSANITMEAISAGNAHLAHYSAIALLDTVHQDVGYKKIFFTERIGNDNRNIDIPIADTMQPGESADLSAPGALKVMYSEFSFANFDMFSWMAVSGTVTLVSRNGDTFSIILTNVVFQPTPISPNEATGSFTVSGTIHN